MVEPAHSPLSHGQEPFSRSFAMPGSGAAFLVALLVFLSAGYIQNSRPGWNVNSQFALTCAIVEHGTFSIDAYHDHPQLETGDKAFFEGHFYSDKSPVTAFLGVPAFAVYRTLVHSAGQDLDYARARFWTTWWSIGLAAAFLALLTAVLLRRAGVPELPAALLSGLWVMATPLFGYAVLFFNYIPAAALALAGFLLVQPALETGRSDTGGAPSTYGFSPAKFLGAGVLLGLSAWTLQTFALLAVLLTLALAWRALRPGTVHRGQRTLALGAWVVGGMIGAAGYAVYSWSIFGEITSPYRYEFNETFREQMAQGLMGAGLPNLKVLQLITVHPFRGLFVLFPLTAAVTFGCLGLLARPKLRLPSIIALLFLLGLLIYNAGYYMWWGGWTYAPRHLIPALSLLSLGLIPWVVSPEGRLRPVSLALIVLIALSGAASNVGVVALDPQPPPGLTEQQLMSPGSITEWPAPYFDLLSIVLRGQTDASWGTALGLSGPLSLMPLAAAWLLLACVIAVFRGVSWWTVAALTATVAMALALRLPHLETVPPGLWFDEALNAQDALQAAVTGDFKLIYADVFPREPLFVSLLALAMKAGAASVASLRLVSVGLGLLTVLALYGALRAAGERGLALAAPAMLAVLRWHAVMSRLLFRTLLLPLWLTMLVWCAYAVRKNPTWSRTIGLGVLLGGGFYTYLSWYFMLPGVLALALWALWPSLRSQNHRLMALSTFAVAAITVAPLAWNYVQHPEHIVSRPRAVSLGGEEGDLSAALDEIRKNALDVLGMFHLAGDHVPTVNLPGAPALDPVMGVFFAVGLGFGLWGCVRRRSLEMIILGWLVLGLAPTILTKTDSPNFLRTCVATPAVACLVALGWVRPMEWMLRRFSLAMLRPVCVMLFGLAVLTSGLLASRDIYLRWARDERVWSSFNAAEAQVGRAARAAPAGVSFWIPESIRNHRTVRFLTRDLNSIHAYRNFAFLRPSPRVRGPRWVVVTVHNQLFPVLKELAPEGRYTDTFEWPNGVTWGLVYEIPEGRLPPPPLVDRAEARHPIDDISW